MKITLGLAMVLLVGCATAFWLAGAIPSETPAAAKSADQLDAQVPRAVRASGFVEPVSETRLLTFKVDGIIGSIPVVVGQRVARGDTLATLQNNDELSLVRWSEKELAVTRAAHNKLLSGAHPLEIEAVERRIAKLQERVRHAQQEYERHLDLFEQKAGSQVVVDLAKTDLQQSREDLLESQANLNQLKNTVRDEDRMLSEAQVELAMARVDSAEIKLGNTVLTAPLDGTVLEVLKREGEAVRAFDPEPVFIFADISELRIRAEVDERFASFICVGDPATIDGQGLGGRRFKGKVVMCKSLMGKKTVFSRDATERKDLDVLEVFVEVEQKLAAPVGLKVDVEIVPRGPPLQGASGKTD